MKPASSPQKRRGYGGGLRIRLPWCPFWLWSFGVVFCFGVCCLVFVVCAVSGLGMTTALPRREVRPFFFTLSCSLSSASSLLCRRALDMRRLTATREWKERVLLSWVLVGTLLWGLVGSSVWLLLLCALGLKKHGGRASNEWCALSLLGELLVTATFDAQGWPLGAMSWAELRFFVVKVMYWAFCRGSANLCLLAVLFVCCVLLCVSFFGLWWSGFFFTYLNFRNCRKDRLRFSAACGSRPNIQNFYTCRYLWCCTLDWIDLEMAPVHKTCPKRFDFPTVGNV